MDTLAKNHSLEQNINFGQPVSSPETSKPIKINEVNFSVNLSNATAENFINYLYDFEQLPYFTSIESVNLTGSGANGWLDFSSLTLSGKLYARE